MENYETLKVTGLVNYKLFDENGNLKEERNVTNTVVTAGKNYLASWVAAASQAGTFMQHIALGTDTTAASAAQTALITETGTRVAGTISSSSNVWQNQATFAAGVSTGAITESGVFSASSAGTMLARQTFAVINKAAGDSLQVTWSITLS